MVKSALYTLLLSKGGGLTLGKYNSTSLRSPV